MVRGDRNGVLAFTTTQTPKVGGDVALTLEAASRSGGGQTPVVLAFKPGQSEAAGGTFVTEGLSPTLQGANNGSTQVPAVLALDVNGSDTAQTPRGFGHGWQGQHNSTNAVLTFTPGFVARGEGPRPQQDLVQTLGANTQGDQAPHIVCLASGQANAEVVRDVVGTLDFCGHGGSYNGQDAYQGRILPAAGRPRRLTPLECERLMGWPDRHTAQGIREDGTAYALSDTARYRLCGNGVGTPVAAWIGRRLTEAHFL